MIVRTDLIEELRIKIDHNGRHIEWDDVIVPMKNIETNYFTATLKRPTEEG